MEGVGPRVTRVEDLTPESCRWLHFKKAECLDGAGRGHTWEYVQRTTRFRETDGVGIFTKVLKKNSPTCVVLVAQFRPPHNNIVLEVPGGVIDRDETIEECAVRELKEETGYSGRVVKVTPEGASEPGVCSSHINFVVLEVDGDLPENQNPKPQLQVGESLEVLLLPLEGLYGTLVQLKQDKGWEVDSRLLTLALGLNLSSVGP